jgi:hypothetical protein
MLYLNKWIDGTDAEAFDNQPPPGGIDIWRCPPGGSIRNRRGV